MDCSIKLRIEYQCELAPDPIESSPMLMVYFDAQNYARRSQLVSLPINGRAVDVTIKGEYLSSAQSIGEPTAIFYASSRTLNDQHVPCRVDAGVATIPVASLRRGAKTKVPLIIHEANGSGIEKGQLTVHVKEIVHPKFHPSPIGEHAQERVMKHMDEWYSRYAKMSSSMRQTIRGTENIRCPIYYGEFGMVNQRVPLPASAFGLFEVPNTNDRYWLNAMDVVMDRIDIPKGSRATLSEMPIQQQAAILVSMQVLLTQYLDYIGDRVDRNNRFVGNYYKPGLRQACENFGNALVWFSGDCEDLALAILISKCAFEDYETSHPELKRLQTMSKQYLAALSLDAVTAGQIRDASEQAPIGAHMNVMYLPTVFVKRAMGVKGNNPHPTLPFRVDQPYAHELPVLVGEGTGKFQPLGEKLSKQRMDEISNAYMNMPSSDAFKKTIFHEPGAPGSFFIGSLVGYTNYWTRLGASVGGFWYVDGRTNTRGLYHSDIAAGHANCKLVPHPPFDSVQMEHMNFAVKQRPPATDLVLSEENMTPIENSILASMQQRINHASGGGGGGGGSETYPIRMFVRAHQLRSSLAEKICAEALATGVQRMDYVFEPISDSVYGYRVTMHIKKNQKQ